MGKWTAMLAEIAPEKNNASGSTRTAKADKCPLLSVLSVPSEGGAAEIRGLDDDRATARRTRLLRLVWSAADAEALVGRLARRDHEMDDRVTCIECARYRPGACGQHRRAGLASPDVGRDLASTLQRCPAFEERAN